MGTNIRQLLSNGTPGYFSKIAIENCGSCGVFELGTKNICSIYSSTPLRNLASTHKLHVSLT